MGRKVLLITTDQQRWDALGCNGGEVARTPVIDRLAETGIRYERPYVQNTICMPSRATILTGQHPRTHGLVASGIPLAEDALSIAGLVGSAGYKTAIVGKAHFEPVLSGDLKFAENRLAAEESTGPYRGFDHAELAVHGPVGMTHYAKWLNKHHPEAAAGFVKPLDPSLGGDTGVPELLYNPVPRELYHTDWVADRVIAWLDSLDQDDDWFCWMSFPDPHHPWDPPASERHRVDWRDLDLPEGYLDPDRATEVLGQKPGHWLAWYDGSAANLEGACMPSVVPSRLTEDNFRELNAIVHISNELVDEACGRVLDHIAARSWADDTDVFYTADHGEFQGDYGLLYKGPYHVDALMRVPLIWNPASSAGTDPAVLAEPVCLQDLAPTICSIAGVEIPAEMDGVLLPSAPGSGRERALVDWESTLDTGYRMRTLVRDGWICTAYEANATNWGLPTAMLGQMLGIELPPRIEYEGTEGELYNLAEDPHQQVNRWDDPAAASLRSDLVADLYDNLPPLRGPLTPPQGIA